MCGSTLRGSASSIPTLPTFQMVVKAATSIVDVASAMAVAGIGLEDLSLRQPTLDDVFLTLTGSAPVGVDATAREGSDL